MYKNTIEKIERITEIGTYGFSVSAIGLVLPTLLYTIVSYYILDLGKESYILLIPTWFVKSSL